MKKTHCLKILKNYVPLLIIILLIISNTYFIIKSSNNNNKIINIPNIKTNNFFNLTYRPKIYYTKNDRNIYTVISNKNKLYGRLIQLKGKELLEYEDDVFELLDNYKNEIELVKVFDNGSELYQSSKMQILYCNNEDNNDIYFYYEDIKDKNNLCISNENETFIQTYKILNIVEGSKLNYLKNYIFVTLMKEGEEPVYTACINSDLYPDLAVGKTYEFTFRYTNTKIELDLDYYSSPSLESIFKNTNLLKIEESNKPIEEQLNTAIRDI